MSDSTRDRVVALRLLMARLEGVSFAEAALLLDVSEPRLAGWLRGEQTIPKTKERRIRSLIGIVHSVVQLVEPAAVGRWFRLSIPSLGGSAPIDVVRSGNLKDIERLTSRYLDPSFT